jgi:hypothetical protein
MNILRIFQERIRAFRQGTSDDWMFPWLRVPSGLKWWLDFTWWIFTWSRIPSGVKWWLNVTWLDFTWLDFYLIALSDWLWVPSWNVSIGFVSLDFALSYFTVRMIGAILKYQDLQQWISK